MLKIIPLVVTLIALGGISFNAQNAQKYLQDFRNSIQQSTSLTGEVNDGSTSTDLFLSSNSSLQNDTPGNLSLPILKAQENTSASQKSAIN